MSIFSKTYPMWTCPKCKGIFKKEKQPHICHRVVLEQHFKNKDTAKELFDCLVKKIRNEIGKCKIISIPCCIHLFGNYDFLAALPKKDGLEIRFALDQKLDTPRLKQSVPISSKSYKHCIDLRSKKEIDGELVKWLNQSYHLREIN